MTRQCPNPECPDLELFGVRGEYSDEGTHCAKCGTALESSSNCGPQRISPVERPTPDVPSVRPVVPLCAPQSSAELVVITSVLRAEGIFHFVHNERFGALKVGPVIPLYNERTVCVQPEDVERAVEALIPSAEPQPTSQLSAGDRLRALLEVLLFGWVMPTARHPYFGRER